MRYIEFANPKSYSLSARDTAGLPKQIERVRPDGIADDIRPNGLGLKSRNRDQTAPTPRELISRGIEFLVDSISQK